MSSKKSTVELDQVLGKVNPDSIDRYLNENTDSIFEDNAFSEYIRNQFREKGFTQQEVFLRADMPERYGYKIVSGDKHTIQRDVVIRLCLAAKFSLEEANRALKLYGVSQLYSRIGRDAVIIVAINSHMFDVDEINEVLRKNGFTELYSFESR
ncbi:MAG: hypothetical protein IJI05_02105 [Erysipelotrichaceae bacterium]|nr:hypothetical protein [Erysipelotrichaceae bacterium]